MKKYTCMALFFFICCLYYYSTEVSAESLNCFFGISCNETQDYNKSIYMNNEFIYEREKLGQLIFSDEAKQAFLKEQLMFNKLESIEK